jgi:predicted negative regulator of RcsB-dependent stress response
MENNVWTVINIVILAAMGILAWLRAPHQNLADSSAAARNLSEALDNALMHQKELEARLETMDRILKEKTYSVTLIFQLGETPLVHSVVIQPVPTNKT